MEALNGVVSNPIPCKLTHTHIGKTGFKTQSCFSNINLMTNNNNNSKGFVNLVVNCCGYENKGQLEYYEGGKKGKIGNGKKGWNGMSNKKKMKLLKGLSKDLITFTDLGFGFNFDSDQINQGFVDDHHYKSLIISQAAEVLLAQLKQLRSEEEKQKKKCKNDKCDSSSSESESSDSECDDVVDMKSMRNQPTETKETRSTSDVQLSTESSILALEGSKNEQMSVDKSCCNMILETTLNKDATIEVFGSNTLNGKQSDLGRKIEVCMGGKCKKSGAAALIEEFQKAIGDEGVVVGCKCMGKCKSGPNVKVSNGFGDDSMRIPSNPLYIGVGSEDVKLIAATYLGTWV